MKVVFTLEVYISTLHPTKIPEMDSNIWTRCLVAGKKRNFEISYLAPTCDNIWPRVKKVKIGLEQIVLLNISGRIKCANLGRLQKQTVLRPNTIFDSIFRMRMSLNATKVQSMLQKPSIFDQKRLKNPNTIISGYPNVINFLLDVHVENWLPGTVPGGWYQEPWTE